MGYLQGSPSALDWRRMIQGGREQMIVLGSLPPNNEDWVAAGIAQRRAIQTIRYADLNTFIVTYGGFIRRPWGKISTLSPEPGAGLRQRDDPANQEERARRYERLVHIAASGSGP